LTIPVTSVAPVVVADAPMVNTLGSVTARLPAVSVRIPLTVAAPPRVALPLDWLIVRLLYVTAAMACAEPL